MAWNPRAREALASSNAYNADLASGIVQVADAAELAATLTNAIPPSDGALVLQVDTLELKRLSGGVYSTILDVDRVNVLTRPALAFENTSGAGQGRLRMEAVTSPYTGTSLFLQDAQGATFASLDDQNLPTGRTITLRHRAAGNAAISTGGASVSVAADQIRLNGTSTEVQSNLNLSATHGLSIGGSAPTGQSLMSVAATTGLPAFIQSLPLTMLPPAGAGASRGDGFTWNGSAWEIGAVAGTGGLTETEVKAYTNYAGTTAGSSTRSNSVTLPADFAAGNTYITTTVADNVSQSTIWVRIADLPAAGTANYVASTDLSSITGTLLLEYNADTRTLVWTAPSGNPRQLSVTLIGSTRSGGTFEGLSDTPGDLTAIAGQTLRINAQGTAVEAYSPVVSPPTLAANSIQAAQLNLAGLADRQTFWTRGIYQETYPVVAAQTFNVTCGSSTISGVLTKGFSSAIGSGTSIAPASFRPTGAARNYTVDAVIGETITGGERIRFVVSPDPGTDINGDFVLELRPPNAETGVRLTFADAAKTISGGDATYTWTGNSALVPSSGNLQVKILEPLENIHATIPTNFSALAGTVAPEQFRNRSITYQRAIAATLQDQAGWRTNAGFAALTSDTDRPLFYSGNQITQRHLPIGSLSGVPSPNAQGQFVPGVTIWNAAGLENLPYGNASQILRMNSAGTGLEWQDLMTGGAGATAFSGLTGNLAINQLPSVTTADNFHVLEVVGGAWRLQQLPFSALTGNIGANQIAASTITNAHLAGQIAFGKLDLGDAAKQTAARSALGITPGAMTIGDDSVLPAMLAADSDAQKLAFRARLGIPESVGYQLLAATMTTGQDLSGDVGYFATAPPVGSLSPSTRAFQLSGSSYTLEEIHDDDVANSLVLVVNPGVPVADRNKITLSVDGRVFHGGDAAHQEIDEYGGTDISEFTWNNTGLRLANNATYEIALGGALEDEISVQIAGQRHLPDQPTTAAYRVLAANSANDAAWRDLTVDAASTAAFFGTITGSRTDNSNTVLALSTRTANTDIVSRSGNVLTIQKDGLYFIGHQATIQASNAGEFQVYFRRASANADLLQTRVSYGYAGPTYPPGTERAVELSRNDTLEIHYAAVGLGASQSRTLHAVIDVHISRVESVIT